MVKIIVITKKLIKRKSPRNFFIQFFFKLGHCTYLLLSIVAKVYTNNSKEAGNFLPDYLSRSLKMNMIVKRLPFTSQEIIISWLNSPQRKEESRLFDGPRRHGNAAYPHICFCCSPFGNENDVTLCEDKPWPFHRRQIIYLLSVRNECARDFSQVPQTIIAKVFFWDKVRLIFEIQRSEIWSATLQSGIKLTCFSENKSWCLILILLRKAH